MMRIMSNEKGFSITELMISMSILAIGLLALAQLQIVAIQGTTVSRQFSTATNLARELAEAVKMPGVYMESSGTLNEDFLSPILINANSENDGADFSPDIVKDTAISSIKYDYIEVLEEDATTRVISQVCGDVNSMPLPYSDGTECADEVADLQPNQYVRIVNMRNFNNKTDETETLKDINVIVLWKERGFTRSVSLRTLVGRKDSAFF